MLERFVNGRAHSNAYVYAPHGPRALIVDAGVGAARKVLDLVTAEGLQPQALLLTHGHPDHIWTARRICERYDIPAYIHADDVAWFADPATGRHLQVVRTVGRAISAVRRMRPARLETVDDAQTLEVGGFSVGVAHTPGHSKGSACLFVDDMCFAGDTVFKGNIGQAMAMGGDRAQLRESIRTKLLPLPDELRLLPGHGSESSVGAERADWVRYLEGS